MGFTCDENGQIIVVDPPSLLFRGPPDSSGLQDICIRYCECAAVAPGIPSGSEGTRVEQCVVVSIADAADAAAAAAAVSMPCVANNYREPSPTDVPNYEMDVVCSEFYGHPTEPDCERANDQMHEEIEADQEAEDYVGELEEFHAFDVTAAWPNLRQNELPKTFPREEDSVSSTGP